MEKILQYAGDSFECECGQTHHIPIKKILVEKGALQKVPELLRELTQEEKVQIVCDKNTYQVAGSELERILSGAGFTPRIVMLEAGQNKKVQPDTDFLFEVMEGIEADGYLIACGSGTINDLVRYVSYKMDRPFLSVGTAPSMDGYASPVSPITVKGVKDTYYAHPPEAIVADISVLKEAPLEMIRSGLGDLLGKISSQLDWRLSNILFSEEYCSFISGMLLEELKVLLELDLNLKDEDNGSASKDNSAGETIADKQTTKSKKKIKAKAKAEAKKEEKTKQEETEKDDAEKTGEEKEQIKKEQIEKEQGIRALTQGLIKSGVAMLMAGTSRPASGTEHHVAHFLEMYSVMYDREITGHGINVGLGEFFAARYYLKLQEVDFTQLKITDSRQQRQRDIEKHYGDRAEFALKNLKRRFMETRLHEEMLHKKDNEIKALISEYLPLLSAVEDKLFSSGIISSQTLEKIPEGWLEKAVRYGFEIRTRFTVATLLKQVGYLDDWITEIMQEFKALS